MRRNRQKNMKKCRIKQLPRKGSRTRPPIPSVLKDHGANTSIHEAAYSGISAERLTNFCIFIINIRKTIVRNVSPTGLEYDKPIADDEDRLTHKKSKRRENRK